MKRDKTKNIKSSGDETNYKIKDVDILNMIPTLTDNFVVTILDEHHTIIMPAHATGLQFQSWKQTRGGVFSKDLLNYTLQKDYGKYVIIETDELHCVARIINDEEKSTFESLKLIDGQIKDKSYMIFKTINEDGSFSETKRYIEEKEIINDEDIHIAITSIPKTSIDDENDEYHVKSISLFTE